MAIFDMRYLRYIGIKKKPKAPWNELYKNKDVKVNVKNISIYDYLKEKVEQGNYYNNAAISYFFNKISYTEFLDKIDICANAFIKSGIKQGDVVTIISANTPEAIISFYALNKIGAVANMLHPLLSENEIKNALIEYSSVMLLFIDVCYTKIKKILKDTNVYQAVVLSAKDSMDFATRMFYNITKNFKVRKPHFNKLYIYWNDFIKRGLSSNINIKYKAKKDNPAAILQSGGTTGVPKGIVLSNGNFNAATEAALKAYPDLCKEDKILGIMPIFHGFGLEVSINDAFCVGAEVVLIPLFKASEFDKIIAKHKPSVLVGVPTLFEALTQNPNMDNVSLDNLKYVIAGGDTLNKERVEKINRFLEKHGAKTKMIQGYGMTEAVAAISVDLKEDSRPGTVGIPWPGIYVKIVEPNSEEELPYNTDGEICICGDVVMLGYYNNEKETNNVLRLHKDGNIWLHSGDIGSMDENGVISYKQRIKRMIVTSGYNVYPAQIEEVLEKHKAVLDVTVIGVPHPYKIEVPKAYIVLKKGYFETKKIKKELMELCKKNLAYYAIPKKFEFRNSLPKTIVGKVDFRKLQEENIKNRSKVKKEK